MSSNPQWNKLQPSVMGTDTSILDYKTMPGLGDDQASFRGFNNSMQAPLQNKDSGLVFGKPAPHSYNYNSYNGSSAMTFPIGTFTANEQQQQQQQRPSGNSNAFSMNGDIFSSSAVSSMPICNSTSTNADSSGGSQGIRETGIIEKLLHSYGFIQCCERQARLFFHFSQFNGNIEHLKIGDPVEFEMTYDRRTGKPIASAVSKIAPEVVGVVLSEERVTGTVTEIKAEGSSQDLQGRISYENRGECFFLPYNKDDVEGNVTLRSGDKVSFQIAANQRGNLGACHIRLENPVHPVKYQGVVCSMKESFGFIERADVVKEIFFHFSEAKLATGDELRLGDDVQFIIQTRNGKEVACNITRLEPGSVVFEDVCTEIVKGQVLKPLERGQHARQQEDALPGRIRYRAADYSEVEIPFGEKDQRGDFTLRHGDWVQFRIATDRRDQLQRATNISLLEESFLVSGERREQGMISSVKEGFGFIKCADRDLRVFFHFNEVLLVEHEPQQDDEVEFTIVQDSLSSYTNTRQSAIRIKLLQPGTVQFETLLEEKVTGVVTKEMQSWPGKVTNSPSKSPSNGEKTPEPGVINYLQGDVKKNIAFYLQDVGYQMNMTAPRVGDKVEFNIVQVKRNKEVIAVDVKLLSYCKPQTVAGGGTGGGVKVLNGMDSGSTTPSSGPRTPPCQGFIAALKDGFGFIETINHDREVFFHFSNLNGQSEKLELGLEVEYNLGSRGSTGSCLSAENVRLLSRGTILPPACAGPLIEGTVVRPLRCVNPDQSQYAGLIQALPEQAEGAGEAAEYEFGITGLLNKRELLQPGDLVQFQLDSEGRAGSIVAVRKKIKATVDAVKGQYGFLAFEVDEGKKLFFHMTEVKDGVSLQPGDTVEFSLVTNQRNGKSSACNVMKVSDNQQRPERLISRLRTISLEEGGPKLTVVRQPRGPDGTRGFSSEARSLRPAGAPIAE